jgi:hypothetical protein
VWNNTTNAGDVGHFNSPDGTVIIDAGGIVANS